MNDKQVKITYYLRLILNFRLTNDKQVKITYYLRLIFNFRLTNDNQIKITDYGYAHLFTADFSLEDDKRKQVMRWFAPESLDKFQFTTQSDIVSI